MNYNIASDKVRLVSDPIVHIKHGVLETTWLFWKEMFWCSYFFHMGDITFQKYSLGFKNISFGMYEEIHYWHISCCYWFIYDTMISTVYFWHCFSVISFKHGVVSIFFWTIEYPCKGSQYIIAYLFVSFKLKTIPQNRIAFPHPLLEKYYTRCMQILENKVKRYLCIILYLLCNVLYN